MRAGDLIRAIEPIQVTALGGEAYARFADDPRLLAVAVVTPEMKPAGLLTRAGFALKMADRFGRALYEKRPVGILIAGEPLLVDVDAPLSLVNAMMLRGDDATLLDGFVGVKDGVYRGVGTGIDVLRATTEAAARTAKRLAAERAKARVTEQSLLELFRNADALAAEKRAALSRKSAEIAQPAPRISEPSELADLFPHINRLFAEMRMRDEALLQALDVAEEANRAKSQFLANTSHELRTPLNAIIGYAELLEETVADHNDPVMCRDARRIADSGRHLLCLINDILDMSKVEAGKLQVHADDFNLAALIGEAVATVMPQARTNKTRVHMDIDPAVGHVQTDGLRVRQCLLNLLSNAVKFTRGGSVVVRARPVRAIQGEVISIDVIDTGIGMAVEEVAKLFQPFTQANAKTTVEFGGTGLGLAITKRLANMLGGDISVTSAPGLGSCFSFTLPAQLPAEIAHAA